MKDFLGQEIKIGDEVIFIEKDYRNLKIGRIKSASDKMLVVEYERSYYGHGGTEMKQYHNQVVKIKRDNKNG